MTDKAFLSALTIVLDEIGKADLTARFREGGDAARADELANAVALLDRWVREQRSQLPEPRLDEMVRAVHRALRDDEDYKALIDEGNLIGAAQLVRNQARKDGGRLRFCWLTLIADELKVILHPVQMNEEGQS